MGWAYEGMLLDEIFPDIGCKLRIIELSLDIFEWIVADNQIVES